MLPDHSSSKKEKEVPTTAVSYAFLSLKMDNQVEVSNVVSPSQFYIVNCKFQKILADLEIAIRKNVTDIFQKFLIGFVAKCCIFLDIDVQEAFSRGSSTRQAGYC